MYSFFPSQRRNDSCTVIFSPTYSRTRAPFEFSHLAKPPRPWMGEGWKRTEPERNPDGARTFLSAATRDGRARLEGSGAVLRGAVAADRNVRAPSGLRLCRAEPCCFVTMQPDNEIHDPFP